MRGTIHLNKRTDLKEEYEDAKKIRNVKKIVWITADVLYAAVYGIVMQKWRRQSGKILRL